MVDLFILFTKFLFLFFLLLVVSACLSFRLLCTCVCVIFSVNGYSIRVLFSALTPFRIVLLMHIALWMKYCAGWLDRIQCSNFSIEFYLKTIVTYGTYKTHGIKKFQGKTNRLRPRPTVRYCVHLLRLSVADLRRRAFHALCRSFRFDSCVFGKWNTFSEKETIILSREFLQKCCSFLFGIASGSTFSRTKCRFDETKPKNK